MCAMMLVLYIYVGFKKIFLGYLGYDRLVYVSIGERAKRNIYDDWDFGRPYRRYSIIALPISGRSGSSNSLFVLCWIKRMALSSHNIFSNFKFAISEALKPSIVANRIIE